MKKDPVEGLGCVDVDMASVTQPMMSLTCSGIHFESGGGTWAQNRMVVIYATSGSYGR
jgi:hypothetical protein